MLPNVKVVVAGLLNSRQPKSILDAACGRGWLGATLNFQATLDGIDLFVEPEPSSGYRNFWRKDLDEGIPDFLPIYDAIVCCAGLDQLGNPLLFFKTARARLPQKGLLLIATPNVWHPDSRLKYLVSGFFPAQRSKPQHFNPKKYLPKLPWSLPQLYLFLKLAGFDGIESHPEGIRRPRHAWEWVVGLPQVLYCAHQRKKSQSMEEMDFWQKVSTVNSLFGRYLIVSATKP